MIRFERVDKRYAGGKAALQNVSIEIAKGELAAITGHSGAGKSTLLNLMSAIEHPTGGRVLINGEDPSRLRSRQLPYLRRQFGLVFQDHRLLFDRNVYENVALPLRIALFQRNAIADQHDSQPLDHFDQFMLKGFPVHLA